MPTHAASKTYGTVAAGQQKEMSGLAFVQAWPTARCRSTPSPHPRLRRHEAQNGRVGRDAEPGDNLLTRPAPCTAAWRRHCSIAAWVWRSTRH